MRSARGSTGVWTGWPKPGIFPPASWIVRTISLRLAVGLEEPRALFGGTQNDRSCAEDSGGDGSVQRPWVGRERHARCDVGRHHPVLRDRDEQEIEEEPLILRRLAAGQEQVEVLREAQPAHQVAGEVAPPYLDAVRVGLADVADGIPCLADLHHAARSSRTRLAPATIAWSFRNASSRGRYFIPQSGATTSRSGGTTSRALRMRSATTSGRLGLARAQVEHAEHDHLARDVTQDRWIEVRLRGFEREVRREAVVELAEERVAGGPFVDDVRVAEAGVEDRLALDPLERAVDRLDRVLARGLWPRLEVRLVDLHDVGTGCLEIPELRVDGLRVREREAPLVRVVVVLSLLGHREGSRNGDLDTPVRDRAQELDVADLDRSRAPDRADDARDGVLVARAVDRDARCTRGRRRRAPSRSGSSSSRDASPRR